MLTPCQLYLTLLSFKKGTHSTIYYFFFQKDSSIVSLHLHCIFSQRCVHPSVLVPKSAISREGDTEDHPLIVSCPKQEFLPFFSINMLQHQTHLNLSSERLKTVGSWPVPCWGEANIFISFWKTTNEWHMATFSSWNLTLMTAYTYAHRLKYLHCRKISRRGIKNSWVNRSTRF